MTDHNSPRTLDEVIATTGDVCCLHGAYGKTYLVYCAEQNRPLYRKLVDYKVARTLVCGGMVLVARL